jgi:hypothetical protein
MSDRPDLADRLASAIVEHGPQSTSTTKLALLVRTRRVDVAAELASNPLFGKTGSGRGTRWYLVDSTSEDPRDGVRDGLGREDRPGSGLDVTRDEFDRLSRQFDRLSRQSDGLSRRVDELERLLAEVRA